jgi:hypothetical protein
MAPVSENPSVKKLRCIQRSVNQHWVGNGFPVRTLFAYPNLGPVPSPFLLLDYAEPLEGLRLDQQHESDVTVEHFQMLPRQNPAYTHEAGYD